VEAIRAQEIALGNLTLEVSRRSGFYPDIFMGYPSLCVSCIEKVWSSRRRASFVGTAASSCLSARATRSGYGA
jgi:hypothetical protein